MKNHSKLINILIVLFNCVFSSASNEYDGEGDDFNVTKVLSRSMREYCLGKICSENEFCDENYFCQCRQGFRNFGEDCIRCAGENGNCTKTNDCCSFHFCIGGVCRKPGANIEFITLTKISLGITFAIILAAIFIFLIKGLLNYVCGRYEQFHREEDASSVNSNVQTYSRPEYTRQNPPSYEVRSDKPPSYEECIRSSQTRLLYDSPPPYVISDNFPSETIATESVGNFPIFNAETLGTQLTARTLAIAYEQGIGNSSERKN